MTRHAAILIGMALALAACAQAPAPAPTREPVPVAVHACVASMRELTSLQLSRQMGAGWNLGNSLEATGGETAWGNPQASQVLMDAVRAAGFRTVRIPVSWKQYANARDDIDPLWMSRVTQVVDDARRAGLFVVLNVHWDGGWLQPLEAREAVADARLAKFWTQIATHFRDHDDMLLFAGTNEVMVEGDYGTPKPEHLAVQAGFNQVFVDAVRATGGCNASRHLVVQAFNTNIDHAVAFASLPRDAASNRLMMEVHYYDPYDFTINPKGTAWQWGASANTPDAVQPWANEAHVDAQFEKMKTRFVDQGVPVILGEFGAMRRAEHPGSEAYVLAWDRYVAHSAWAHGAVPIYWDAGAPNENHSMGLFDRATVRQVHPEVIRALVDAAR
jgi:endoglucanase